MKCLAIAVTVALLAACGGSGGDDSKPLFSLWTSETGAKTDVSGGEFGKSFFLNAYYASGAQCQCVVTVIGDESEGAIISNSCRFVVGSYAGGDPGCSSANGRVTYSKDGSTLRVRYSDGRIITYR